MLLTFCRPRPDTVQRLGDVDPRFHGTMTEIVWFQYTLSEESRLDLDFKRHSQSRHFACSRADTFSEHFQDAHSSHCVEFWTVPDSGCIPYPRP